MGRVAHFLKSHSREGKGNVYHNYFLCKGRPHWRKRNIEGKQYLSNMGTRSTYLLPSMATFVTSNKPDLQVTIKEESCPVPYNSSWPPFPDLPLAPSVTPAPSSSRPDRETRASVIKKTSDITQARVKSC